jgi:ATP-dependent DNA helicase RecG
MLCSSDNDSARERLDILNKSNDGFFIANEDLKLRGPGDFFGVRQSGEMLFKLGDIYNNAEVLKRANDAVIFLEKHDYPLKDLVEDDQKGIQL